MNRKGSACLFVVVSGTLLLAVSSSRLFYSFSLGFFSALAARQSLISWSSWKHFEQCFSNFSYISVAVTSSPVEYSMTKDVIRGSRPFI